MSVYRHGVVCYPALKVPIAVVVNTKRVAAFANPAPIFQLR
jgi:hypothetical protein